MTSRKNHGNLTEAWLLASRLPHRGKGREGNKEGKGREVRGETPHHGVAFVTREPGDGMMR